MDKKKLMIIGGVVAVLLVAGAVNKFVGKSAAERALEAATGGDVEVTENGDETTVTTDQGTWSTSDSLPKDFPSDVPLYANAKVQGSLVSGDTASTGHYVGLETSDALAAVVVWYKKELEAKGWSTVTAAVVNEGHIFSATKDGRVLSVTISEADGSVSIGLVVATK